MKTFNQAGKDKLISILEAHAEADNIVQGSYWEDGKGCAVGCTLHNYGVDTSDHSQYENIFGIPQVLAKLEDTIFEGLSVESSKHWPLLFANAVPVDTDISNVFPKFMMFILTDPEHGVIKYAKTDRVREVVQNSSDLYLSWPNIDPARAASAAGDASAAAWAASAAAWAARAAGDASAAAWAARAAGAAAWAARAAGDAAGAAWTAGAAAGAAWTAGAAARQDYYKAMAFKLIELLQESAPSEEGMTND